MPKKKKAPMSTRLNSYLREKTGARKVQDGLEGREPESRGKNAPRSAPAPKLSPRRRKEFKTKGIFDQSKLDDANRATAAKDKKKPRKRGFFGKPDA